MKNNLKHNGRIKLTDSLHIGSSRCFLVSLSQSLYQTINYEKVQAIFSFN